MRLLLDTHVVIWWDEGAKLSREADAAIREAEQVYVSAVSGAEIGIKASLGKLSPRRTLATAVEEAGFEELPLRLRHAESLATLPWLHRDPFDRLLVAQARAERLTIVTRDQALAAYEVRILFA